MIERLTEQQAKQILLNAQMASYPNRDVPELLKPLYNYIEQVEAEAERLRAELETLKEHHEGLKTAYKLKRRVCDEWQAKTELATNQELCEYVYRVKDIDRQIDDHLAGLEG